MDILRPSQAAPYNTDGESNDAIEEMQERDGEHEVASTARRLETLNEWVLAATLGLVGFLMLPWGFSPVVMGKEIALIVLTAAAAILWVSQVMTAGTIRITRSYWYIPLGGILLLSGLSTWLSLSAPRSIWQSDAPAESFSGIIVAVVLALLLFNANRPAAVFRKSLLLFLPAGGLLALANLAALMGKPLFPFDFAKIAGFNTVGSQNAFSLFVVVAFVVALAAQRMPRQNSDFDARAPSVAERVSRGSYAIRYGIIVLEAVLLANLFLINFATSWYLLALGVAIMIGIRMVEGEQRDIRRVGLLLPLLVVAVVFGLIRQQIITPRQELPLEVVPTRNATLSIARQVFAEGVTRMALGSGPGTFVYDWEKYQDPSINNTIFWGVRFRQGASGIFTALPTLGILGTIAYLIALIYALVIAMRRFRVRSEEFAGLFAGSAVLGAAWLLYPTNLTLNTLLFGMLALLAALVASGRREINFAGTPRQAVLIAMGLVIFLVGVVAGLYRAGERYVAYWQAQRGILAFNQKGDITAALPLLARGASIAPREDALRRLFAEALAIRLQGQLQQGSGATAEEAGNTYNSAKQIANETVNENRLDGNNWATLAGIYEMVIPVGELGIEQEAVKAYNGWASASPHNPVPYVASARARMTAGDRLAVLANQQGVTAATKKDFETRRTELLKGAAESLENAIKLKGDYADAHFLLAQVLDRQGNIALAIKKAEDTRRLDVQSIGIAFQLGFLYYKGERYGEAEAEFQRAIAIQPSYSNARYFLGILLDRKGDKDGAIKQFEEVEKLNTGNEEVSRILSNLKAGRGALENIVPPAPAPEERPAPPVQDEGGQNEKTLPEQP